MTDAIQSITFSEIPEPASFVMMFGALLARIVRRRAS
jgi:hypothetical protein